MKPRHFRPAFLMAVGGVSWLLISSVAAAAPTPPVAEIRKSLAGEWTGTLGYRDYQTNQLFELPVKTTVENIPDGVTQVRRSVFDEGARRAPVWIVSISQQQDASLVTSTMRAGRNAEIMKETVEAVQYVGPDNWRLVYRQTAMDDDKPAEIRVTEALEGGQLLSIKEVRPTGDKDAPWQFRNQTKLTRSTPAP